MKERPINPSKPPKTTTPIYIKTDPKDPMPEDPMAYVLGGNGLFVCRTNQFMTTCVPAPGWPSGLADQRTFMKYRYPKIPRRLFELAVGFFSVVYDCHRAESAVLLLWDMTKQRVRLLVPEQKATVSRGWSGKTYPMNVKYELPTSLPPGCLLIGDMHCHGDFAAYSSHVDKHDEQFRSGIHVVVGEITHEPPTFHIEAVVDGTRFTVREQLALEGYTRRRTGVPREWMDRIQIEKWSAASQTYGQSYSNPWSPTISSKGSPSTGSTDAWRTEDDDNGANDYDLDSGR